MENQTILQTNEKVLKVIKNAVAPAPKKAEKRDPNAIIFALSFLLKTVQIAHETAYVIGKSINFNVENENEAIQLEGDFHFLTISKSAINKIQKSQRAFFIETVQQKNLRISAERNVVSQKYNSLSQNNQADETKVNTVVDEDEESFSQFGALTNMLTSLTNQIAQIS